MGGKGITEPLKPYLRKDQEEAMASGGYIDLRPYGLGYQLPIMLPSDSESDSEVSEVGEAFPSSTTTSWGSAITLPSFMRQPSGDEDEEVQSDADSERSSLKFFKRCTVNMVSVDEPSMRKMKCTSSSKKRQNRNRTLSLQLKMKFREHNLGTTENPRPIFLSALLGEEERAEYMRLLQEFSDVFAWSYAEMPGLDPEVAMHRLNIREDTKPVKQPQRKFHPAIMEKIEKEVQKLKDVGFIREEQHPDWLANIVPVTMKNSKILVCIDFSNLNDACPKDEFPFPITEIMIKNTFGYERMSFMDGFSGYNQIKMYPEDQKHTSFRTPFGVYC